MKPSWKRRQMDDVLLHDLIPFLLVSCSGKLNLILQQ
jgi:hypothetical protein